MARRRPRPDVWRQGAALVVCALVAVSSTAPARAAPGASVDDKITLTADRVEYNTQTRIGRADGHARVTAMGVVITADHLEVNTQTQDIVAMGNVTLTRGDSKSTGSLLRYNARTHEGRIEQMTGTSPPWHVTADAVDVGPKEDVAYGASITSCDPAHPVYLVTAKKIEIVPNDHFTAYEASLWVAGVRVITLPSYTGAFGRPSGPSMGINSVDGVYLDYTNSFRVGELLDVYRVRLGTSSGLSAANTISERFNDHLFTVYLGRSEPLNPAGNLVSVDRYSADLEYDPIKIPGTPLDFQVEAHAGSYNELATGVSTARFEGILNVSTERFEVGPNLYASLGGQYRFDAYGTGQQRTAEGISAALIGSVGDRGTAILSYSFTDLYGSTPFSFDGIQASNSLTLIYNYSFRGSLIDELTSFISYDFLQQQYTFNLSLAMHVTANTLVNVSAWYNLTTQQVTEVDFAVNQRCDCVAVGLLYKTYPQTPSANTLMVTATVNAFPGQPLSVSGTGVNSTNP